MKIPAETTGECTLYLNLPDPKTTLHDNPMFSIRLANDNIWVEDKGYNRLVVLTATGITPEDPELDSDSMTSTGEDAILGSEFNPW